MYSGDVNSYILMLSNELELPWDMSWEDMLLATGAFEQADVITFHFTTDFDDDIVKEELEGLRYEMGEYALVIDRVEASFQRVVVKMRCDFGREMTLEELKAVDMPSVLVTCVGKDGSMGEAQRADGGDIIEINGDQWEKAFIIDAHMDASNAAALIVEGRDFDRETREWVPREGFRFTIDLP